MSSSDPIDPVKQSTPASTTTSSCALKMFQHMQQKMAASISEEDRESFRKLGEKFHSSFDITRGEPHDLSTICMEEALAYTIESLKSGLHPSMLTEDEKALLTAGYGEEWYSQWGYTAKDLKSL